jgi:polar amino acid transport system substrate-binding protein
MKPRIRTGLLATVLLSLVVGATLTGCGDDDGDGNTLERIRETGIVRVGFANEAPYAYSGSDGRLAGFMPAEMEYVFGQIGDIQLEGVLTEFSGLIPGLIAGRFDVVGAGLYINPSRCELATPSNPQYTAAEGMAVAAGNPLGIASYADLVAQGAQFGTVSGSINLEYAVNAGIPEGDVVLFPDVPAALAGLSAGRVDAVGMGALSLLNVMGQMGDTSIELAEPFSPPADANSYGAVYFRMEDTDLIELYNAELAEALESGELLAVLESVGFGTETLPPVGLTAEELCQG